MSSIDIATEAGLQTVLGLIGNSDDADGSETSGTVSGKLNGILNATSDGVDIRERDPITIVVGSASSTTVSITGKGKAAFIAAPYSGGYFSEVDNLVVDGTTLAAEIIGEYGHMFEVEFLQSLSFNYDPSSTSGKSSYKYTICLY